MAHLTLEQRYKIEAYKNTGNRISEIAQLIGKHKSVVSREIKRNSDQRNGNYKAQLADKKANFRHQIKPKKQSLTPQVEDTILFYLQKDYSPEQIVGRAKLDQVHMVSSERIYQYIWENKRKVGFFINTFEAKGKNIKKEGV